MEEKIRFLCEHCGGKVRFKAEYVGRKANCPLCKGALVIPEKSTLEEDFKATASTSASKNKKVAGGSGLKAKAVAAPKVEEIDPNEAIAHMKRKIEERDEQELALTSADVPPDPNGEYIAFKCPGCDAPIGFPALFRQQPQSCPKCHAHVMVPDKSGGVSFMVGILDDEDERKGAGLPPEAVKYAAAGGGVLVVLLIAWMVFGTKKTPPAEKNTATVADTAKQESPAPKDTAVTAQTQIETPAPAVVDERPKVAHSPIPTDVIIKRTDTPASTTKVSLPEVKASSPEPVRAEDDPTSLLTLRENKTARAGNEDDEEEMVEATPKPETPAKPKTVQGDPFSMNDAPEADAPAQPEPPAMAEKKPQPDGQGVDPFGNPQPEGQAPTAAPVPQEAPKSARLSENYAPIPGARPFVNVEGMPAPPAQAWLPWTYGPNYKGKRDPQELLTDAQKRYERAKLKHQQWEKVMELNFLQVDTHHLTLHCQATPAIAQKIGMACEQLTVQLQAMTRSVDLTATRSDTHEIIMCWDNASYQKALSGLEKLSPGVDYTLARQGIGSSSRSFGIYHARGGNSTPPERMALFQFAKMLMAEATDDKAPDWLKEGFAAWSENKVTKKNLCYGFRYEMNEVEFGQDWNADIKKFAMQRKLKEWKFIFPLDLIGMKSLDYLTCFSMVSYLIEMDAPRFMNMLYEIRDGKTSEEAMEKCYGRKVPELQMMWARWAMSRR